MGFQGNHVWWKSFGQRIPASLILSNPNYPLFTLHQNRFWASVRGEDVELKWNWLATVKFWNDVLELSWSEVDGNPLSLGFPPIVSSHVKNSTFSISLNLNKSWRWRMLIENRFNDNKRKVWNSRRKRINCVWWKFSLQRISTSLILSN